DAAWDPSERSGVARIFDGPFHPPTPPSAKRMRIARYARLGIREAACDGRARLGNAAAGPAQEHGSQLPCLRFGVADGQHEVGECFEARSVAVFQGQGNMALVAMRQAQADERLRLLG